MIPATYDFSVVRGSSGQSQGLTVRLKTRNEAGDPVAMLFDDVRLSIYNKPTELNGSTLILRATLMTGEIVATDEYEGEVRWVPTAEATRSLRVGAKNHYELEVRNGDEEAVYLLGTITGVGGINDDDEA